MNYGNAAGRIKWLLFSIVDDASNTYLNCFGVRFDEQIEQRAAEVMRVAIWVAQLIGHCIQEQIAAFVVQVDNQILEDVHV